MAGRFSIVGVGPGDPELVTLKAARLIGEADVVAFHAGVRKSSHARRIAGDLVRPGTVEEELRYPVTTGTTDHPGGYDGALADFYAECGDRLGAHLAAGRHVVLLAAGAPRPAAIVGCPVGFIGAAESKDALASFAGDHGIDVPFVTVRGRRGGSAITSSAVNALASEEE